MIIIVNVDLVDFISKFCIRNLYLIIYIYVYKIR